MDIHSKTTTILLIDPNSNDRKQWVERLTSGFPHYRVFEAEDAGRALTLYKTEHIDCVVMELHLPDLSGFQVLMRLNPIVRSLKTPVVTLSHFILPSIVEVAKRLGAQSYLIKAQTSGDDLHRAIQQAITAVGPNSSALCK